MDIEREILAWVTRVDMFIISTWPYVLLAVILFVILLLAWTISDCVIRIQRMNEAELLLLSAWPWLLAILALCLAFIAAEIWISRK